MAAEVAIKKVVLKLWRKVLCHGGSYHSKVPEATPPAVLVKNLYLSCDPFGRFFMSRPEEGSNFVCTPGSPVRGYGVAKVVDSTHPDFKVGDYSWETTFWEEYSFITPTNSHFKSSHTDVPLSYYCAC